MPTFGVKVGNAEYEVDAPDEATAYKWAQMSHHIGGSAGTFTPESEEFKRGREMPTWAQRSLHIADVLGAGLPKKFMTPKGEQLVRGSIAQFKQTNPFEAGAETIGGSMIPGAGVLAAPRGAVTVVKPIARSLAESLSSSAPQSALSAVGASESRDPIELLKEAGKGATIGGVLGVGMTAGGAGAGAVGRNIAARVSERGAASDAQRELIKALKRDVPYGSVVARDPTMLASRAGARLERLGPDALLVDVGGESTRALADVLTQLPGRARQGFAQAQISRQAGRADRLMRAADQALKTGGKDFATTFEGLAAQREAQAAPLYDMIRNVSIPVDARLQSILKATESAHGEAELLAKLRNIGPVDLSKTKTSDSVPFIMLDNLKQTLYDMESAAKRAGSNNKAAAYSQKRRELTAYMDEVLPKDQSGQSIYAQARRAYEGPSQIRDAMEAGRDALGSKTLDLKETVAALSPSEIEGFRIGLLQGLREKTGTEAGQTSLLKMWKEPATSNKLRLVFGDDYRQFAAAVAKERALKNMETIGKGSQTFSRLSQADDLGRALEAGAEAGTAATTGNVGGIISTARRLYGQARLPESTRNQLAQMLLLRGPAAQAQLDALEKAILKMERNRQRGAVAAGTLGGAGTSALFRE